MTCGETSGTGKKTSGPKVFLLVLVLWTVCLTGLFGGFILVRSPRLKVVEGFAPTYLDLTRRNDLRLLADALPASAKDIYYRVYPYMPDVKASFRLERTEFLQWARTRAWKPAPISTPFEADAYMQGKLVGLTVKDGYQWKDGEFKPGDPSSWGWDLDVIYDSDRGEVYYSFVAAD